ncbi:phosphotransferase family protein [Sphaerimonospora cavernae]|uniref:Phosphotransferase family protein n=1 Tax=Sphaerimonospora cavernae TaxID=1740611 RepID=A0ABV6TZR2_9ACTN
MAAMQWEDLPAAVREAVQARFGSVLKAETVTAGMMPGIAACLHADSGERLFLKAIPGDNPTARRYERERWAGTVLPRTVPTPRLLWSSIGSDWITMVFEYADGRAADLLPASTDLPAVLATVARLGFLLTPCPAIVAPPVTDNVGFLLAESQHLLDKPDGVLPHRKLYAAALDGFDPEHLTGDTLLHYDLHAGNLQVTSSGVKVIDWAFAAVGAPWIDAFMLGPRLIEAGHTPEQAERLLAQVPAWGEAPRRSVNGLLASWTLFRFSKAMYGPAEGREFRARAAAAGRAWLIYRTATT